MRQVGGFKKYQGSTNLVIPNLVGGRTNRICYQFNLEGEREGEIRDNIYVSGLKTGHIYSANVY